MTTVHGLNMHYMVTKPRVEKTVVLLHGFTGSAKTWNQIVAAFEEKYRVMAIDLIGHGLTDSPKDVSHYTMAEQVELLHDFFMQRGLQSFTLVGYSMGGRVAIAYALKYPETVEQLVLESSSPGLESTSEREARVAKDGELANKIEEQGIEAFVNYWEEIPLFATQKKLSVDDQAEVRAERLAQQPRGLANSLRGMGTGQQDSYWEQLGEFTKPVLLVTGELDEKFCDKAKAMLNLFPNYQHIVVPNAGHAIHVENPVTFATIIEEHI